MCGRAFTVKRTWSRPPLYCSPRCRELEGEYRDIDRLLGAQ
jgi:hypothetical protein